MLRTLVSKSEIWEGPDDMLSPNRRTPREIIATRKMIGTNEIKRPGFFIYLFYIPLKSTNSKASVGICHLLEFLGSVPISIILFHREIIFPVTFISLIG